MNRKLMIACIAMVVFSSLLLADPCDLLITSGRCKPFELVSKKYKKSYRGHRGPRGPRGPRGIPGICGAAPAFTATQMIHVNMAGNDVAGNGSVQKPFLTIMHAMSVITDASPTKRYVILVGPGTYDEYIDLKANVCISGSSPALTRVGSIALNDSTWLGDADNRSEVSNLTVSGTLTLDFVAVLSSRGQVRISHSQVFEEVMSIGCHSDNALFVDKCEFMQNVFHQGGALHWSASSVFGDITIRNQTSRVNPEGHQAVRTQFHGLGGGLIVPATHSGALPNFFVLNNVQSPKQHEILVDLVGFAIQGNLTITGDGAAGDTRIVADADSIPPSERITFTDSNIDSKSLITSTCSNGIGYQPGNPSNWASPAPTKVQEALDRMASVLATLNANTPIP